MWCCDASFEPHFGPLFGPLQDRSERLEFLPFYLISGSYACKEQYTTKIPCMIKSHLNIDLDKLHSIFLHNDQHYRLCTLGFTVFLFVICVFVHTKTPTSLMVLWVKKT